MIRFFTAFMIAASAITPASAVTLLTSGDSYSGPLVRIGPIAEGFQPLDQPIRLGPVTVQAVFNDADDGAPAFVDAATIGGYGFGPNGAALSARLIASNSLSNAVRLSFASPVQSFGGYFNYAPIEGWSAFLDTFDIDGVRIARFDFNAQAPIDTPDAIDVFRFRGIDVGTGASISSVVFGGAYVALAESPAAVPEPGSWALLVVGFGLTGMALRRHRLTQAGAPRERPLLA
jgi:hypothetical protein